MSVSAFDSGDRFVVRIVKSHDNNPSDQWVNSYEFVMAVTGTEASLLAMGDTVVAFEKLIHMTPVNFDRMIISTWEADSVPYDPEAFISVSLTGSGATGVVDGFEPLNECLSVARVCAFGRQGHLFYRGCLDAAEVFAPSGRAALIDDTEIQGRIDEALTTSGLSDFISPTSGDVANLAMINADGTQTRLVVGLVAAGVSFVPLDHAWFNRTTGPAARRRGNVKKPATLEQ